MLRNDGNCERMKMMGKIVQHDENCWKIMELMETSDDGTFWKMMNTMKIMDNMKHDSKMV